jgi:16S rRNA (cytidine1402-2'-O)-methyltransferase
MTGTLFVCATPIGNLEDVSARLIRVLGEADVIAAEDTRTTRGLLTRHGIRGRPVSYHDANERSRTPELVERLKKGESVALVTESGMPAISDPGYRLIGAAIESGVRVEVVPGPSAALSALVVSGLPTARFAFEGFLPRKQGPRRRRLEALRTDERTMIFFEASNRLKDLLSEVIGTLGDRRVAVARELTKVHEEVLRGLASEVLGDLRDPRGEVVLVVEGADAEEDFPGAVEEAKSLVAQGMTKSKAAARAAEASGVRRSDVYQALLED